ncbi:hypothetical protein ACH4E7_04205 [Kitasatospora sp. NPDC018058]|uniref:hypothetical protein n=1 Tax=Kitasatospora sp. NPDC018058 TaxID=3364025 RepID=UPI0037BFC87E
MENPDQFSEFVSAVAALHDDGPVRITAHTSNASPHGWNASRSNVTAEAPTDDTQL